jgi:hypothetical protein
MAGCMAGCMEDYKVDCKEDYLDTAMDMGCLDTAMDMGFQDMDYLGRDHDLGVLDDLGDHPAHDRYLVRRNLDDLGLTLVHPEPNTARLPQDRILR